VAEILGAFPVSLKRYATGARNSDGGWTPGATTTTTIQASVQPLTERELASLPEGERQKDWRKILTTEALVVGRQGAATQGDRLSWDSGASWYEVRQADQWFSVLPHTEAKVSRLDETDS
jgi:hypothetical protein